MLVLDVVLHVCIIIVISLLAVYVISMMYVRMYLRVWFLDVVLHFALLL